MLYGMYLSAAGALIEEARQAVIANNIANVSTEGYKADTAVFRKRLSEAREHPGSGRVSEPALEGLTGGVFLDQVAFSGAPGPILSTKDPLHLSLNGDGFFAVSDGSTVFYTRAGNFQLNGLGELVTADGRYKVLGADRKPIRIGRGEVKVSASGEIVVGGKRAGRLLILGSADPALFEKVGGAYFRYLGSGMPPPSKAQVMQGCLEGSNVSAVSEMVKLVQSHRAYEANLQMAKIQDTSLGKAVNELPRITA